MAQYPVNGLECSWDYFDRFRPRLTALSQMKKIFFRISANNQPLPVYSTNFTKTFLSLLIFYCEILSD